MLPLRGFELRPILLNLNKLERVLALRSLTEAENCPNIKKKHLFLLVVIFTNSVEPVFQSHGPISQHMVLREQCVIKLHPMCGEVL